MSFYRKPAQGVAKKKEQLLAQLSDKEDEKADLEAQMRELDKQLQQQVGPNGTKPKTEAEVKAYMKEVAGRATTCKNYKSMSLISHLSNINLDCHTHAHFDSKICR